VDQKGGKEMKWRSHESLIVSDSTSLPAAKKVAAFDMDDTLVKTKTGLVFAKGRGDWQWKFKEVPSRLKKAVSEGYQIVIFTNQNGIAKGQTKAADIKGKISDMSQALGIPIIALIATGKDKYRKPSTDLWDYFVSEVNKGVTPTEAIFVGDAAGRSSGDGRPKKDHSASDRAFAANIGIDFETPEEYFLGHAPEPFRWDTFDPSTLKKVKKPLHEGGLPLTSYKQELVIFVGFPASGKSTFAKKHMIPKGYVHVNRDTLKTKEKCIKVAKQALDEGSSVVVDNTNPSLEARGEFLALAKKHKIQARCFFFDVKQDLAAHLNKYREFQSDGVHTAVPSIAYNMYRNKLTLPTEEEGFVEVKKINFVPSFDNEDEEKLFYKFM